MIARDAFEAGERAVLEGTLDVQRGERSREVAADHDLVEQLQAARLRESGTVES